MFLILYYSFSNQIASKIFDGIERFEGLFRVLRYRVVSKPSFTCVRSHHEELVRHLMRQCDSRNMTQPKSNIFYFLLELENKN